MEIPCDISGLQQLVQDLLKRIEALETENAVLKAELGQNSSNSHRPPSSDGFTKQAALPKKKQRLPGGQQGHRGHTLQMVEQADHTVVCRAEVCVCGQGLHQVQGWLKERRQVFDLPEPNLEVTEYQRYACSCPVCGRLVSGNFPAKVDGPVQYGSGVKALVTLLSNSYCLSYGKIQCLFADLFGYALNENTMWQANQVCYQALGASEQCIKAIIKESQVTHFDETGLRVAGKLEWLHTASTAEYTYQFVHIKRGKEALQSACSLLPDFTGWAVHDCWASYFAFDQCKHAVCGAHLLRELQALIEQGSQWAASMHALLLRLYHQTQQGTSALKPDSIRPFWQEYDHLCEQADRQEVPPEYKLRGKPKKSKGRNLMERLVKYKPAVLAFALYPEVPFTNNQAERDIPPAKVKQKVAGCFRTTTGALIYARIQSFVSTLRKQKRNVFQELHSAMKGNYCLDFSTT